MVAVTGESNVTRKQLLRVVSLMFGNFGEKPNPDDPQEPGPWDPLIREAFERSSVFGPFPQPWRQRFDAEQILRIIARRFPQIWDVIGDGRSFDMDALNPHPLPPRLAFAESLARVVIRRAQLIRDIIASLDNSSFQERGIIVVGGREFLSVIDEWCGNDFRLVLPIPRPPWWNDSFDPIDYLIMAGQFEQSTREIGHEDLQRIFHESAAKLVDAALARLQ